MQNGHRELGVVSGHLHHMQFLYFFGGGSGLSWFFQQKKPTTTAIAPTPAPLCAHQFTIKTNLAFGIRIKRRFHAHRFCDLAHAIGAKVNEHETLFFLIYFIYEKKKGTAARNGPPLLSPRNIFFRVGF